MLTIGLAVIVETEYSGTEPGGDVINKDRVQIRIPELHGTMKEEQMPEGREDLWVKDEDLPWVNIVYPVGTSSPNKSLLKKDEIVYVVMDNTNSITRPVILGTTGKLIDKGE